jgi:hypothetical protein
MQYRAKKHTNLKVKILMAFKITTLERWLKT